MEVLAQAAAEISADLPTGVVEVRLRGRGPGLVVDVPDALPAAVAPTSPTPSPGREDAGADPGDDEGVARITLRLPESVKTKAEELAAGSGHSLNVLERRHLPRTTLTPHASEGTAMNDFRRLTALYADDLSVQRDRAARRSLRNSTPRRRTTRSALASGLHRLADRLDGE